MKNNNIVYFLSNGEIFKFGETSRTAEIRAKELNQREHLKKPLYVLGYVELKGNSSVRKFIEGCIRFEYQQKKGYRIVKDDFVIRQYGKKLMSDKTFLRNGLEIIKEYASFKGIEYKVVTL